MLVPAARLDEGVRARARLNESAGDASTDQARLAALRARRMQLEQQLVAAKQQQGEAAAAAQRSSAQLAQACAPVAEADMAAVRHRIAVLTRAAHWDIVCFERNAAVFSIGGVRATFGFASDGATVTVATFETPRKFAPALLDLPALGARMAGLSLKQVCVRMCCASREQGRRWRSRRWSCGARRRCIPRCRPSASHTLCAAHR